MLIEERKDLKGYSLKSGRNIIKLKKLGKHLYEFEKFKISSANLKIITLFQEKFYAFAKRNKVEIMTENTARDRNQNRFMRDCGLKIKFSKNLFTRNLRTFRSTYKDVFCYTSFTEIELHKLHKLFKLCIKDSIESYIRFRKYSNKLKRLVRNVYDYENWKIVSLNNKAIGIIMPHVFPEEPGLGTLLEIGLKPEYRGKGYGRIIHAHGLEILKQMGAKKYLGSTETTNYAMLRVFKLNGCRKLFKRHFFIAPPKSMSAL